MRTRRRRLEAAPDTEIDDMLLGRAEAENFQFSISIFQFLIINPFPVFIKTGFLGDNHHILLKSGTALRRHN